jgi:membrane-associated phospholipid phosphatase
MDGIIETGIEWIIAIQSLGGWLELPMKFFTFLGNEAFYFLVLPFLYWGVDTSLGLKIALFLGASNYLNSILKLLFAAPRPYWVSAQVKPLAHETSFGIPSGHAQNAAALWGLIASWLNKPWAWMLAFLLAVLIGFSRLYLGVHFVHDVVLGWLLGYMLLLAFLKFWDPVARWLKGRTLLQQIMIPFVVSLVMIVAGFWATAPLKGYVFPAEWAENARRAGPLPDPASVEDTFTFAGLLFGLAVGIAWTESRGGFQTAGPLTKRLLRYVLGLIGIVILWFGLGQVFPDGETALPLILRYVRYALVGFWVTGGAPWLFFHFKLADPPKMWDDRLL